MNFYGIGVFFTVVLVFFIIAFVVCILTLPRRNLFFFYGWILYFFAAIMVGIILSLFLSNPQKFGYQKIGNSNTISNNSVNNVEITIDNSIGGYNEKITR